MKLPAHLSDEEAATLPCAAVTAWNALVREARIKAGDTVVCLGTGGVSLFALQFAKLHGARVILTSSSDEKLESRAPAGCGRPDQLSQPARLGEGGRSTDWRPRRRPRGGGRRQRAPSTSRVAAVRFGGTVCLIGVLTGVGGTVNTASILRRHVRIQGIYVGSREMFEEMNRAIAQHQLRPVIGSTFAFEEARAAYDYLASGAHTGKVTIRR